MSELHQPEEQIFRKLLVEELLAELTPLERKVAELLWLEGRTLEETGILLGETVRDKPLGESGVRYHRDKARQKCLNLLT